LRPVYIKGIIYDSLDKIVGRDNKMLEETKEQLAHLEERLELLRRRL
jgi:tRNA(Phe) wybutosine-synthesizing methylase Tyw3